MDLPALGRLAQLLPIQPGADRTPSGVLPDQRIEVSHLCQIQFVRVVEQIQARSLELRADLLPQPIHRIESRRVVRDDVKPVNRRSRTGQMFVHTLDEGQRHSDARRPVPELDERRRPATPI